MKKCTAILIPVLFFSAYAATPEPAPGFELKKPDGAIIKLEQFKGSIVVIDFWAIWCAACKEAFPALNKIQSDRAADSVKVIGINLDNKDPAKVAVFVQKAKIAYIVVCDPQGTTTKSYQIKGVPSLVVVDKEGDIAGRFRGYTKSEEAKIRKLLDDLTKPASTEK
jgi:thiol-disulfide isomerase/thioredoxin